MKKVALVILAMFFAGNAIGQGSPEIAWQNQMMQNQMIQEAYKLSPKSGSICGKMVLEGEFACGIYNATAATTQKFLEAQWRLEKILVYFPSKTRGKIGTTPKDFKELQTANPTTPVDIHWCDTNADCEKVGWMAVFVPKAKN